MKIAAIQMKAKLGNVKMNLGLAEKLAIDAFKQGAEWVILPEFFTTAMGYHKKLLNTQRPINGKPTKLLKTLAKKYNGVVGGSFLSQKNSDYYNTFILAFPDGSTYYHDKDQPTMWENCYYIKGEDDGILKTPSLNVGVALCWEFIRSRTPKRLINKVDLVVGGSCWWTLPETQVPGFPKSIHKRNEVIYYQTPGKLAKMLGVHVVHAAHAGKFKGNMPLVPFFRYNSSYLGETQIVNGKGKILARLTQDEGNGVILADINPSQKWKPSEKIPKGFWIPHLPFQIRLMWWYQNLHGKFLYYPRKKRK